jgi:hypothetical protein
MRVTSGEDDDFACFERDRFTTDNISEAPAFSDHMKPLAKATGMESWKCGN